MFIASFIGDIVTNSNKSVVEESQNGSPKPGDILVMVGTKKGTFLFWSNADRDAWQRSAHHLGWSSNAVNYDPRHGAIYAATNSAVLGL